MSETKSQLL